MTLYERVESLWLHNNRGLTFERFVDDYMYRNFGVDALHEEYVGDEDDNEIYLGDIEWKYKLDVENTKIELFLEE